LSKNNNSDLFTPLMEGFIEIMQLFVEKGATHLGTSFQKTASGDKSKHPMKVEFEMLFDETQVTGPETLGHSINQDAPYKLSYLTPELHTFIIGASGWGKSNLLNILMEDNLKSGRPIIFIDPKGTKEAIKDFKSLCKSYNRKCAIFSEHSPERMKFNCFSSMNADQALIMLMRSFNWGDSPNEYYLNCSREALKKVLNYLYASKQKFGLKEIYKELEAKHATEETKGLRTQLHLLVHSIFGHLFDAEHEEDTMNLTKAWEQGYCVYIGISTMGYQTLAQTIGKMFVSELQILAHNIGIRFDDQREAIKRSIGVFIDEAASVLFSDFIDLANKARSSGICLTVASQSYSDMEMIGGSSTLMKQLMESFSTWFVQRQLDAENAEKLASIFGTHISEKKTVMTESGAESGKGSLREAYEFICHPEILKSLHVGQSILLTMNPKDVHLLNIRNAKATQQNKEEDKKERTNYMTLGGQA
jgi:conjugal transfer pilus assembly protein TraD